jgi:hypothetical protein
VSRNVDLPQSASSEDPDHSLSRIRPHRQEVDDVGPALAVLIPVAHQAGRDRVSVGVVADQDAAEVVACLLVERFKKCA